MNNKDENCRNHLITQLRNVHLEDEYLKFKLADMINAYRPHDEPLSQQELYEQFGAPVDRITRLSMDSVVQQANELPVENYH